MPKVIEVTEVSDETLKYLQEVFGYSRVEDIDTETLKCIKENADEGYPADKEIIKAHGEIKNTKNTKGRGKKMKAITKDDFTYARRLLYIRGLLSDMENDKVKRRIEKFTDGQ